MEPKRRGREDRRREKMLEVHVQYIHMCIDEYIGTTNEKIKL